jgi:hypothetical protein
MSGRPTARDSTMPVTLTSVHPRAQCVDLRATFAAIDQVTLQDVAAAMRQRYRITPCPACGGPLVSSKQTSAARCLRCGYTPDQATHRCWECGAAVVPCLPADLARENAMGRARPEQMAAFMTCRACGGQADEPDVARRSWRTCDGCKKPLRGVPRPARGPDLCVACRDRREQQQSRERGRRWRSRRHGEAANFTNVSRARFEPCRAGSGIESIERIPPQSRLPRSGCRGTPEAPDSTIGLSDEEMHAGGSNEAGA